jgi:hypothetical protein
VVAVAVDAGWGDQAGEGSQELQPRDGKEVPAVGQRTGGEVDDSTNGAGASVTVASVSLLWPRLQPCGSLALLMNSTNEITEQREQESAAQNHCSERSKAENMASHARVA